MPRLFPYAPSMYETSPENSCDDLSSDILASPVLEKLEQRFLIFRHFCYFCLASNLASDPQYKCPICKTTLQMENIQPLRGNQNNHLVL